jgi:hypothetical protein
MAVFGTGFTTTGGTHWTMIEVDGFEGFNDKVGPGILNGGETGASSAGDAKDIPPPDPLEKTA